MVILQKQHHYLSPTIYFSHDAVGFNQDNNNFLVMHDVIVFKGTAFAIFQPFLCGLVAGDVKVPGNFGHIFKVLRLFDIDFAGSVFLVSEIGDRNRRQITFSLKAKTWFVLLFILKKMYVSQN